MRLLLVLSVALSYLLSFSTTHATEQLEKISIQFNWKPQFQFAGYIAAKEKGFYEQAGLDVEFIEFQFGINTFEEVLEHKADYGVSQSSVYAKDGKIVPIELLATYFQKSPHVLATTKNIKSPHDLVGKTIMISQDLLRQSPLGLVFSHFYINENNTNFVDENFKLDDFIEQKVDAVSIYSTDEPYQLQQRGVEFNIIDPADYGYSLTLEHLFTSPEYALQHPDITQKLVNASNKGWAYALANKEEIVALIHNKYAPNESLDNLMFEANETEKIIQANRTPIGTIKHSAQQNVVKQLKRSRILDDDQFLKTKYDDGLFSPEQLAYLRNKQEITFCVSPSWMPIEAIKDGQYIGMVADIFDGFRKQLPVPLNLVETHDWNETMTKAKSRECDLIASATKTVSRIPYFDFTTAYLEVPIVVVTRMDTVYINDLKEVKHQKIGAIKGFASAERLRQQIPGINIVDVSSITEGLALVEKGELFGYIDNLIVLSIPLQQTYNGALKVSARLDFQSVSSVATRKDEPLLHDVFEKLVNEISESEMQEIRNKWVAIQQTATVDYSLVWKVLVATLILSLAYFYYYLRLKHLKDDLLVLSTTDKLTGLYNRAKLDDIISHEKADLDRYGSKISLILIDLDLFKSINDNFGHLIGDSVLKEFSAIVKSNVRTTDYVGRWGGEEFLIVCPNIGIDAATELAEKLLAIVRAYSFSGAGNVTFSAGVCGLVQGETVELALKRADKALYHSKETGRDKVTKFDDI